MDVLLVERDEHPQQGDKTLGRLDIDKDIGSAASDSPSQMHLKLGELGVTMSQRCPFDRWPNEVLLAFFEQAVEICPPIPIILIQVCTLWKRLVETTPNLWTRININGHDHDYLEIALVHIAYSGDRPIHLSITNGMHETVHIIMRLFQGHWGRIIALHWSSFNLEGLGIQFSSLLHCAIALESLSTDTLTSECLDPISSLRKIKNLDILVYFTTLLEPLIIVASSLPLLEFLRLEFKFTNFQHQTFQNRITLKVKHFVVDARFCSRANLVQWLSWSIDIASVCSLEIYEPFGGTHRREIQFSAPRISRLTAQVAKSFHKSPNLVSISSTNLTEVEISSPALPHDILRPLKSPLQSLSLAPQLVRLRFEMRTASFADDVLSDSPNLHFPCLRCFQIAISSESDLGLFLCLEVTTLQQLQVGLASPLPRDNLLKVRSDSHIKWLYRLLSQNRQLHTLELRGIVWPFQPGSIQSLELPFLRILTVTMASVMDLDPILARAQSLHLSLLRAQDKASDLDGNLRQYNGVESLSLSPGDRIQALSCSCVDFSSLRILSVGSLYSQSPTVTRLIEDLLRFRLCPWLEELNLGVYEDWGALIRLICSRNNTQSTFVGVRPLQRIGLQKPNALIHNTIRDALAGSEVGPQLVQANLLAKYVSFAHVSMADPIPSDVFEPCLECNNLWIYDNLSGYKGSTTCQSHIGDARVTITKDSQTLG
ncbi:hypothetical protein PIIN_04648 [Serendipita indica DSM 11827]|uniref:F-box domain-containing protein n=1 Tax=Serendipita indica (strain DSM 11827) TaxID=1109443 RepID=G4THC8_SERID|nr:hypothetical protein PIIN_04648 [Serendipita indica DSM 11827]